MSGEPAPAPGAGGLRAGGSLFRRLGLAIVAVLAAFGLVVGAVLEAAMRERLEEAAAERLRAHADTLLGAAELDAAGALRIPESLSVARFNIPDSGLYAAIVGDGFRWVSASAAEEQPRLPDGPLAPGETVFRTGVDLGPERAIVYRLGFAWEVPAGSDRRFVLTVAEHERRLEAQLRGVRHALWLALALALAALLGVQLLVLRWGLAPLRRLAAGLGAIRRGRQELLTGSYPRELVDLARSLNRFVQAERRQQDRHRHSLADLAHSLKTPLAVLRSGLEAGEEGAELLAQVDRLDERIAQQLRRARATGTRVLAAPQVVEPVARQVLAALAKVHPGKAVRQELDIPAGTAFYGDRGDLMEILGNLLENAVKWCRSRVRVEARQLPAGAAGRPGLSLCVEDDGPGISEAEKLLQRGVRGDERVPGHGLGLAIVDDMVEAYGGQLEIGRGTLGGARISVRFPEE